MEMFADIDELLDSEWLVQQHSPDLWNVESASEKAVSYINSVPRHAATVSSSVPDDRLFLRTKKFSWCIEFDNIPSDVAVRLCVQDEDPQRKSMLEREAVGRKLVERTTIDIDEQQNVVNITLSLGNKCTRVFFKDRPIYFECRLSDTIMVSKSVVFLVLCCMLTQGKCVGAYRLVSFGVASVSALRCSAAWV
jgi:hypothetical protein